MRKMGILLFSIIMFIRLTGQEEGRLMRFPAIHGEQVVFSYAGDLYTVEKNGGVARKLTNDEGYEMFARFSPDGSQIAFTAQYDGNTEVYLMPAQGGEPRRLTYTATLSRDDISDRMGPNNIVMTWKDNEQIVFRSRMKSFNAFKGQLFSISVEGGLPYQLPLNVGSWCSYSPDRKKLAYNRVFREFRTWKYYRGGMADDIWIFNFENSETENITNNDAQDIFPMWHGEKIYYLSDRDRTMNLFVYDLNSKETRKLTDYTNFDIKFPSLGDQEIIYENGGYLYRFDLQEEKPYKIEVLFANDFIHGRDELVDASKYISSHAIAPDGKRVVFGARGDVFTVPANKGIIRNLTQTPGVHDRNVEWSPDGKFISFISDRTGEDEIYIIKQDGSEPPMQLTKNSDTYKYNPIWSPDSKKLLWSDKKLRLQYLDVETKKIIQVDQAEDWEIRQYNWSPDSKWITYTIPKNKASTRIWIYDTESEEKKPVTDQWYNSGNPVFGSDGNYLFFTSSRDFNPIYSHTEWNHAYRDMEKVYFLTLRKSVPNPLRPENDEVETDENKTEETEEENGADKGIEFDGIFDRIEVLPIEAANYGRINVVDKNVYYVRRKSSDKSSSLRLFDLEKKKETDLGDYGNYTISTDHKKMLLSKSGKYTVIDLPSSPIKVSDHLDLDNMKVWVNYREEWTQIYNESWRQMRDFFYDPNMHGVDWEAMHEKYAPLVDHVENRNDLNYVIGELIGELNVGHAYVGGGDRPKPERIKVGLLGAEVERDESGYYRITKILEGENWMDNTRSPLTEIGVDIFEGDYILAVNGKPVNNMENIYRALLDEAGEQVELIINNEPEMEGSRKVIVIPTDDESGIYYFNWVRNNIKKVEEATNGQVGYIHVPDMGPGGLNQFVKYFYPQLRKKGLIIDDRGNGGGNVSPMLIERLNRELVLLGSARNTKTTTTKPGEMHIGPKVLLIDMYSASDGDLFPYQFKKLEIGPVIGVRSWGGVVGIRGSMPFIDGGSLRKPEFAPFDVEGKRWVIEGYGVEPDIRVVNDPAMEYQGIDQQLNMAIEVILEELEDHEELPEKPGYPDKTE
ncbi:MAG: PDZ domain-containing protein [Bacteroidales bacterium]|nr:PDZ domain-containing protein [Bacteroidales bacterium]MCF8350050.1 PDZ domain-containing protein [Bacteroidales bacterium]MCF8375206.1 PDZ domain-containing protein [Bacteroidales bacterium]MCF8400230.1 PDZ domain-containing protein [Bacteroidales bacterium]